MFQNWQIAGTKVCVPCEIRESIFPENRRGHPFVTILRISIFDILLKNFQIIKLFRSIFSRKNNQFLFIHASELDL